MIYLTCVIIYALATYHFHQGIERKERQPTIASFRVSGGPTRL